MDEPTAPLGRRRRHRPGHADRAGVPALLGHSARVAELGVRLGLALGRSPEQLRALAPGAYLHDVGKIAIPDAILKSGVVPAPTRDAVTVAEAAEACHGHHPAE